MDTSLDSKRIDSYRAAPENIRALYANLDLGTVLGNLSTKFGFDEVTQKLFINVIGDAILGFFPKADIRQRLVSQVGMTDENADISINSLGKFIEMIIGNAAIPEAPKDLKEKLELRPENAPVVESAPTTEGGVRPLTRDEVLRALAPARTMAGDIASLSTQTPTPQVVPQTPPTPAA